MTAPRQRSDAELVLRIVLGLFIGTALLGITALIAPMQLDFMRTSTVTQGHVTRQTAGGHHPDVAFEARSGQRFELPMSASTPVKVGDMVPVRYRPDDPRPGAAIDSFESIWGMPVFSGVMGIISILSGVASLCEYRRRTAKAKSPQS